MEQPSKGMGKKVERKGENRACLLCASIDW
jgi:hypothetical protein